MANFLIFVDRHKAATSLFPKAFFKISRVSPGFRLGRTARTRGWEKPPRSISRSAVPPLVAVDHPQLCDLRGGGVQPAGKKIPGVPLVNSMKVHRGQAALALKNAFKPSSQQERPPQRAAAFLFSV